MIKSKISFQPKYRAEVKTLTALSFQQPWAGPGQRKHGSGALISILFEDFHSVRIVLSLCSVHLKTREWMDFQRIPQPALQEGPASTGQEPAHLQFGILSFVRKFLAGQNLQTFKLAEYLVNACLDFVFYYCIKD